MNATIDYLKERASQENPETLELMRRMIRTTADGGFYAVERYGAKGDGSADDTGKVQSAIDACNRGGGGTVFFDGPASYRMNATLKPGVVLQGLNVIQQPNSTEFVRVLPAVSGNVVDTPETSLSGAAVKGLAFRGLGASTGATGIKLRDGLRVTLSDLSFNSFSGPAIEVDQGTIGAIMHNIFAQNCLLARTGEIQGVIDLRGTDHWLDIIEVTASLGEAQYDEDTAALVVYSANSTIRGVVAEISGTGVIVDTSAFYNSFNGGRADLNLGHGVIVKGYENSFSGFRSVRNSQLTNDTFNGFEITGDYNVFSSCISGSISSDARKQHLGYHDTGEGNEFAACGGRNNVSGVGLA